MDETSDLQEKKQLNLIRISKHPLSYDVGVMQWITCNFTMAHTRSITDNVHFNNAFSYFRKYVHFEGDKIPF